MEGLETGKDKVKKICDVLKKETLEPALAEAQKILDAAKAEALKIEESARHKAAQLKADVEAEMQKQQRIFEASLAQSCRQVIESLKQQIEEEFLNKQLSELLKHDLKEPKLIAELIEGLIRAIEKQGLKGDLSVAIGASVAPRAVNELLAKHTLEKLREKSVVLGPMHAGVSVTLHRNKMTIEMTDETLKELIGNYIRPDFRKYVFS